MWVWCLSWEDNPGEGNGNLLQYSCQKNPMDTGAWWARVHGAARSWTRLSPHTLIIMILCNVSLIFHVSCSFVLLSSPLC